MIGIKKKPIAVKCEWAIARTPAYTAKTANTSTIVFF